MTVTKCFKLASGEELLAIVVDEDAFQFTLENPAQIAVQAKEDGTMGLMICQFMPYAEGDIIIYKSAIASVGTPVQGLIDEYNSKFEDEVEETPLIQVPDRKIII
jgi:hypothetical protein